MLLVSYAVIYSLMHVSRDWLTFDYLTTGSVYKRFSVKFKFPNYPGIYRKLKNIFLDIIIRIFWSI